MLLLLRVSFSRKEGGDEEGANPNVGNIVIALVINLLYFPKVSVEPAIKGYATYWG
jgi:hypothetical protein